MKRLKASLWNSFSLNGSWDRVTDTRIQTGKNGISLVQTKQENNFFVWCAWVAGMCWARRKQKNTDEKWILQFIF